MFFAALFAATLALRLCHSRILWADEDYHIASGLQTLFGRMLYRDVWYDKPPLSAWIYAAIDAPRGWRLRLFGAIYVLAICVALFRFARSIWSEREAMVAAGLAAFFLNFDLPASIIPLVPDYFLLLPHIVAVHCAWRGRAFSAGIWAGIGLLLNPKALFVLAVCGLMGMQSLPWLLAGFAIPSGLMVAILASGGALRDYFRQVWFWGFAYAKNSPISDPSLNGIHRTLDWLGFHLALLLGAIAFWWNSRDRTAARLAMWTLVSFVGVALGMRFLPRYYFLILPPLILAAARGICLILENRVWRVRAALVIALALAIPLVRFGPRYLFLARDLIERRDTHWTDLNLDQDSQAIARIIDVRKHAGDSIVIWGYRPGIVVYTRLPVGSRYWDSQPLTGIPADRPFAISESSMAPDWAASNRRELASSEPTFIVRVGRSQGPGDYPELRDWMKRYEVIGRTDLSVVYRRLP